MTAERPNPPYSGDIVAPNNPNSAILSAINLGYLSSDSNSLTNGFTSFSRNLSILSSINLSSSKTLEEALTSITLCSFIKTTPKIN